MLTRALLGAVALCAAVAGSARSAVWTWSSAPIEMVSNVTLTFAPRSAGEANSCEVTFRGTVTTEPFSIVGPVSNVGSITSATATGCTRAVPTFLVEPATPWPITYVRDTYIGLPESPGNVLFRITEARFLLAGFGELGTSDCLYTGEIGFKYRTIGRERYPWTFPAGALGLLGEDQFYSTIIALRGVCPTPTVLGGFVTESWGPELTITGQIPNPWPVEFGRVEAGSVTRRSVKLSSSSEVTIRSIGVRSGRRFAITDPNECVGSRIAGDTRCSFDVLFDAPSEAERSVEDTVLIETSEGTVEDVVTGTT